MRVYDRRTAGHEHRRSRHGVAFAFVLIGVAGLAVSCTSFHAAKLYQSGSRALERGDSRTAIRDLEEASRLAPQASEIQNHLGLAYALAGEHIRAQESFDRAVALDCENQAAQQNRRSHRGVAAGAVP